eukprot:7331829-Pyramimonas_sp.AAC.1
MYYNELGYALKEYTRVMNSIIPVAKPLLGPHIEDLEKKISPGLYILTWTSMNIDGYLQRVHSGLARLEELIDKINDILENRVDANLKVVSRTMLIDLPSDRSFSFEDFVQTQTKFIKNASKSLIIKNHEVERA